MSIFALPDFLPDLNKPNIVTSPFLSVSGGFPAPAHLIHFITLYRPKLFVKLVKNS